MAKVVSEKTRVAIEKQAFRSRNSGIAMMTASIAQTIWQDRIRRNLEPAGHGEKP
jgi:hypothetical protein